MKEGLPSLASTVLDTNVIAALCQKRAIRELALFGSVTRHDFTPESDVDILVEFEPGAEIGLFDLVDIRDELVALVGRKVDLVTKPMLSPLFRDEVMANREVIYVVPQ